MLHKFALMISLGQEDKFHVFVQNWKKEIICY